MLELALKFVPVGGGNIVCASKITAVVPNDGRLAEKVIGTAKKTNRYVALTNGRKSRSIIMMDNGIVFTSRLRTETLFKRLEETSDTALKQIKDDVKDARRDVDYQFLEDDLATEEEEEQDAALDNDTAFFADGDTESDEDDDEEEP